VDWAIRLPAVPDLLLSGLLVALLGAIAARLSVTRRTRF
jgi:cell division transport system permease protein